jgi:hypothetical protein
MGIASNGGSHVFFYPKIIHNLFASPRTFC